LTGTPPEGENKSDPERIAFWRTQWQTMTIGGGILMAIVLVLLVVVLLR
jgi:hypothetical protein